uniref:Crystaline entomocidal protoxin n=1 Tax=Bacillus thuringiensis TaxID=1428 RepID=A0A7G0XLN7_BACTU|nr:insecticidal crystal protein [Bacillus thuringiensis]
MTQNNNEYEIIDQNTSPYSSNRNNNNSRYPFANNPNQALQQTNYKDWINMCQKNQQCGENLETFASADTIAAVSAGVIVVGTMLGAFGAPVTTGLIISFGTLLPIFWGPSEDPKKVWKEFLTIGNRPFGSEVDQGIIDLLYTKVNGLRSQFEDFQRYFDLWKNNKNPVNADVVRQKFLSLDSDVIRELETLKGNYYITLLPGYTQVANWHLNLLRQAAYYYDEWAPSSNLSIQSIYPQDYTNDLQTCLDNCPSESGNKVSSAYYKCILKCRINEYINYCSKTYQEGLNKLKNSSDIKWNIYNEYRREMTLTVLDLIAAFPNYDLEKYPIGTKCELTREVYTNALMGSSSMSIAELEKSLTKDPFLITWLNKILLYTRNYKQPTTEDVFVFTGNQLRYSFTMDSNLGYSGFYGDVSYTDDTEQILEIPGNSQIVKVEVERHRDSPDIIWKIDFHLNNGAVLKYNSGSTADPNFRVRDVLTIPPDSKGNASHFLSYMKSAYVTSDVKQLRRVSFAWTHNSINYNNEIYNDIITQIAAVKGHYLGLEGLASRVIQGPGHTGGDLVDLKDDLRLACQHSGTQQSYYIRIRYASDGDTRIVLVIPLMESQNIPLKSTFSGVNHDELKYKDFGYVQFPGEITLNQHSKITLIFRLQDIYSNISVFIDKIEFIPITSSIRENREKYQLEKAKRAVDDLFISAKKQNIKIDITDYQIDQTANLVDSLSEEPYPQEKMMLLNQIKYAKQLSQSRNLLSNGDFESLIGWTTSSSITVQTGNTIFKGFSLHMLGARTTEINATVFPTYVYQKIDESRLKPYTRYIVRGFIGSSKGLGIFVTRYNNVPDKLAYIRSTNSCGELNQYESQNYSLVSENNSTMSLQNITASNDTSCLSENLRYCEPNQLYPTCHNLHDFSFSIDTGELDFNENPGIWILFKISNPDGYATLGNLEVIEEKTLVGEEINNVKEKGKRWKKEMDTKQTKTETAFSQAQQAVNGLFMNTQYSMLKIETTMQDIVTADNLINEIPYVYDELLPNEPAGRNYNMFIELKNQISQVYSLYNARNIIQNGNFNNGLKNWHTSPDAKVQKIDNTSVLVIPNWSTQVSQHTNLQQNQRYLLRVTAKKEGMGNGYVKVSDCANNVETLTFKSSDITNNNMWNESIGYMTKTMYITPHTSQVRIDIGETEGNFKINSIELICIKN